MENTTMEPKRGLTAEISQEYPGNINVNSTIGLEGSVFKGNSKMCWESERDLSLPMMSEGILAKNRYWPSRSRNNLSAILYKGKPES